jgi:hypothetical protein
LVWDSNNTIQLFELLRHHNMTCILWFRLCFNLVPKSNGCHHVLKMWWYSSEKEQHRERDIAKIITPMILFSNRNMARNFTPGKSRNLNALKSKWLETGVNKKKVGSCTSAGKTSQALVQDQANCISEIALELQSEQANDFDQPSRSPHSTQKSVSFCHHLHLMRPQANFEKFESDLDLAPFHKPIIALLELQSHLVQKQIKKLKGLQQQTFKSRVKST